MKIIEDLREYIDSLHGGADYNGARRDYENAIDLLRLIQLRLEQYSPDRIPPLHEVVNFYKSNPVTFNKILQGKIK